MDVMPPVKGYRSVCIHIACSFPFRKGGQQSRYGADLREDSRFCARRRFGQMWSEDMNGTTSIVPINSEKSRMWMKYTETRQMAIPHQGNRILSSHGPSSPTCRKVIQRERQGVLLRRTRNGIARAVEDLRGMRLSLVQGTNTGDCVLQAM